MAWLRKAFARAKANNSLGLALMAHANPGFENFWPQTLHRALFPHVPRLQVTEPGAGLRL